MEKKLEKKSTENNKRLSYEELNNAAHQISAQAKALYDENITLKKKLQTYNFNAYFTQLNFKFKIVEMSDKFPKDFVDKITAEIMEDMDMSEPTKEESDGK